MCGCAVERFAGDRTVWPTTCAAVQLVVETVTEDTLQTRVDLMSQMQETRNACNAFSQTLHSPTKSSPGGPARCDALDLSQKVRSWCPEISSSPAHHLSDWDAPQLVMPFCRDLFGANLEISEDGYRAMRTRGCRQSVAIGTAPLSLDQSMATQMTASAGRYFEILVEETVPGWVGGLGIGVAQSPIQTMKMNAMKRLPDKAWRIPKTTMVGDLDVGRLLGLHLREWQRVQHRVAAGHAARWVKGAFGVWPAQTWQLPHWLQLWRCMASNYQVRCLAGAAGGWAFLEMEVQHLWLLGCSNHPIAWGEITLGRSTCKWKLRKNHYIFFWHHFIFLESHGRSSI
eukprot:Skav229561  [mRNA]  locus=scaffold568:495719:499630:+ [translate_table: standard]